MPRQRSACSRCAAIKSSCNSERPCLRCKRLSLLCSYNRSRPSASVVSGRLNDGGRQRAKHTRSITGCLNCLKRRRKCDESHPECRECRRQGLRCTPRSGVPHDAQKDSQMSQFNSGYDISLQNVNDHSPIEVESPTQLSYNEWALLIEDNILPEPIRRGNLDGSSALARERKGRIAQAPMGYLALDHLTGVTFAAVEDWPLTEHYLLNHFIQVVARALAVVGDDMNPFIINIMPMVITYESVRHAVLALAACHIRKVYPDFQEQVLFQKSQALSALKHDIEIGLASEAVLAATIMLCLLEVFQGNSHRWILHLYGAKASLEAMTVDLKSNPTVGFLFCLYNLISSIATVTSDKAPKMLVAGPTNLPFGDELLRINPLFGVGQEIYKALFHIRCLANQRTTRYETGITNTVFLKEAATIEKFLQDWKEPCDPASPESDIHEAAATANAIRWAAVLWLHQVTHGHDVSHPTVKLCLTEILRGISRIRPGSKAEARILFPLFMAGTASTTKANRFTVEYRLSVIDATIGIGGISTVHRVLDLVWKRTNDGEVNVDWESLLHEEFPGAILF